MCFKYRSKRPAALLSVSILVLFFLFSFPSLSQEFGGNPPSMRWRQINTDTARIIYPVSLESQAQRVANLVHHIGKNAYGSIGDRHKKINIVLQNQTVVSNGLGGNLVFEVLKRRGRLEFEPSAIIQHQGIPTPGRVPFIF